MGFFEKFTNPIWHVVSTLDAKRQVIAAMLIIGYPASRFTVKRDLMVPLEKGGLIPVGHKRAHGAEERLIDEALVGLLKSCSVPENDPSGKYPDRIVAGLADVWGVLALADRNYRLQCTEPTTLDGSQYSRDPDEARAQVLVKWAEILGTTSIDFVTKANRQGFYTEWNALSSVWISGCLQGSARTPDEVILRKARSEAAGIPSHRVPMTRYMLESLAKMPIIPNGAGVERKRPEVASGKGQTGSTPQAEELSSDHRLHGVRRDQDGKAHILLSPDAGPLDFIRSMLVAMRPSLLPHHMKTVDRWVSVVTGKPILHGQWSAEHEDIFVRGFERFLWEGDREVEAADTALLKIKMLLRETYPSVAGTRIDVPLTDDMRKMFRSWFAKEAKSVQPAPRIDEVARSGSSGRQAQPQTLGVNTAPNSEKVRAAAQEIQVEMLDRGHYYRHNHFRGITDWEQRMVNEFGHRVVPLLRSIWDRMS
jgi:hypothetical protein